MEKNQKDIVSMTKTKDKKEKLDKFFTDLQERKVNREKLADKK